VAGEASFLVEELLEAVASQLDRTQDALAFKAVNRPLNYAIKDFNLQLQAFVEMGEDGVRLRSCGPNEAGASTISIGFTTITRPMVEENTISLAATRAPSLAEAGFAPAERQRLERLGVRNTNQLRRLGTTTGATTVSRLTQIPVERLRAALQLGEPEVTSVRPATNGHLNQGYGRLRAQENLGPAVVPLGTDTKHIHVYGNGLTTDEGWPEARLDGAPTRVTEADWDRIVVAIPDDVHNALLELFLPGGEVKRFQIVRQPLENRDAAGDYTEDWDDEVPQP
jgi:hypothetical protein